MIQVGEGGGMYLEEDGHSSVRACSIRPVTVVGCLKDRWRILKRGNGGKGSDQRHV